MGLILGAPRNPQAAVLVAEVLALQDLLDSQATARSDTANTGKGARTMSCSWFSSVEEQAKN